MIQKASSFTSFRKIINKASITCIDQKTDRISQGELMIQSKLEDQPLELGLQSEKSRIQGQGVRSSIDSQQHRKKESSKSIPLSELILRDNGYDHLFHSKGQIQKMEQNYVDNVRQLKSQTEQMMRMIEFQLLLIEEAQIKSKMYDIQKSIIKLRACRKSKSPIQQNSDYLHQINRINRQRLSGRLLRIHAKQNVSNTKTQCDSKAPSLPSAPVTPINQYKLITSPSKNRHSQYVAILRAKKQVLLQSINTIYQYNCQRSSQLKQENNIIRQQLLMTNSRIQINPLLRTYILSSERNIDGYRSSSTRKNISSRRLIGLCSPQTQRSSKKSQMIKLISDMRSETRLNPRQEYFLSSR